jgi:acetyl/propionyl-CoA carboxylase alpha subunit
MTEERVQRTIRRVLVAARGEPAATLVELLEGHGIETVAVFDARDAEAPHLDTASWAAPLPEHPAERHAAVLCDQALDAGADAILPGPAESEGSLAADTDAARTVGACGLAWIAPGPTWTERVADLPAARDAASTAGLPILHDAIGADADTLELALLGDGSHAVAWADARVGSAWTISPAGLDAHVRATLRTGAAAWAAHAGLAGPAVARFRVDAHGVPRADRLVPGLPRWHALVVVEDLPLALAAVHILAGRDVPSPPDDRVERHALEVRVRAVEAGLLEDVELPDGVRATLGCAPGQEVTPGEVLCALRVEASDHDAVRRAARDAVARTGIHGVATDAEALCAALAARAPGVC